MYVHQRQEILVVAAADLSSTGDKGVWGPGYIPVVIRAVAAKITNTIGATGTINFDKRITLGSDTGRVDNVIGALALTTSHTGGKIVYRDGLNIRINPGEEIVVAADDAAAAGDLADVSIVVEPSWERPANHSAMVATA
jgi:hypothetical protein